MFNQRLGPTSTSLDSSESYQLPSKTQSGDISWYQATSLTLPTLRAPARVAVAGPSAFAQHITLSQSLSVGSLECIVVLRFLGIVVELACLGEHALNARRRRRATEELATHLGKRGEPSKARTRMTAR